MNAMGALSSLSIPAIVSPLGNEPEMLFYITMTSTPTIGRLKVVQHFLANDLACAARLGAAKCKFRQRGGQEQFFPRETVRVVETMLARNIDPVTAGKVAILMVASEVLGILPPEYLQDMKKSCIRGKLGQSTHDGIGTVLRP
jgi:hypothetical protein